MEPHEIVSQEDWLAARKALLWKEKQLTHLRDELSAERRRLPWVKINKRYVFDGPDGKQTLAELFAGRSQLIVKHFMLAPGQLDPCVGCSFEVDHIDGALVHLENHDVTYVAVSRAPLAEINSVRRRMGWHFKWVSAFGSDFNYDFHASFTQEQIARGAAYSNYRFCDPGIEDISGRSVFYKNAAGDIFQTYATFGRGAEELIGTYIILDLLPKGRNETGPRYNLTDWVRHHDRYGENGYVNSQGRYVAGQRDECCHPSEQRSA